MYKTFRDINLRHIIFRIILSCLVLQRHQKKSNISGKLLLLHYIITKCIFSFVVWMVVVLVLRAWNAMMSENSYMSVQIREQNEWTMNISKPSRDETRKQKFRVYLWSLCLISICLMSLFGLEFQMTRERYCSQWQFHLGSIYAYRLFKIFSF